MADAPKAPGKSVRWVAAGLLVLLLGVILLVTYPIWGAVVVWGPRLRRADEENRAELAGRRERIGESRILNKEG